MSHENSIVRKVHQQAIQVVLIDYKNPHAMYQFESAICKNFLYALGKVCFRMSLIDYSYEINDSNYI